MRLILGEAEDIDGAADRLWQFLSRLFGYFLTVVLTPVACGWRFLLRDSNSIGRQNCYLRVTPISKGMASVLFVPFWLPSTM